MTQQEIDFARKYIVSKLKFIIDDDFKAEDVTDIILDDVIDDIQETADEIDWTSADIDIAIGRVLYKKIIK